MDKRKLLSKFAAVFGRKGAPAPTQGQPAEPAAGAGAAPSAETEPQPIGEIMPPIGPDTPTDQRLAHSLDDAVAVTERAGQMLEAQAKQQQQATDAVAELASMVQTLTDQVAANGEALEAIRTQLGQSAESAERLAEQFNEAAAKLATTGGDSATLGEGLAALTTAVDELRGSVAQQGRNERDALAEISRGLHKDLALLRWLVIAAGVLAGAAVAATFVVKLL